MSSNSHQLSWLGLLSPSLHKDHSQHGHLLASIKPDDAEVLRIGKWIRYDSALLVKGDVIRMEEGNVVPEDCMLVELIHKRTIG